MNVQNYEQLYTKLRDLFVSNLDDVTDLNEGSVISTIFEAVARIVERLYIDVRNGYANNLLQLAYSIFGFKKKDGVKATSTVIFSRTKAIDEESIISVGTKVSSGAYIFTTTSIGKIAPGELESNPIPVVAESIGVEYNVAAKEINNIETVVSEDIVKVENPSKAIGGANAETETEMLARFKTFINGLQGTNPYGLESTILSHPNVRSMSVLEHFPPLDHIYNGTIYVEDGTGGLTNELKAEIQEIIDGNGTATKPGCRATGLQFNVLPPTIVPINITVRCDIFRTDHSKAMFDVKNALEEEINSMGIGESIILTSLILRLRQLSYVKDVPLLELNGDLANVKITKDSIARAGVFDIDFNDV